MQDHNWKPQLQFPPTLIRQHILLQGCQNQVFILFCDDTCPDYPNQKHENHAHGERVEDQRVHDSDASLIGSVVRKQLVHLILAPLDAE